MSHFTSLKSQMKDSEILKKVLAQSGFQVIEDPQGTEVRGFMGDTQKADFKVLTKTHYDIGFIKNEEGTYEIVGDWELMPRVADIEKESFSRWLRREYAKETVLNVAAQNNYEVEEIQEDQEGVIQLIVRK